MLLQLPHCLFNPAGVTISVEAGKPEALEIQTCDAKGCYAGMPLAAEWLTTMRKGVRLRVEFQNLSRQTITMPVPLKGFTAACKKL